MQEKQHDIYCVIRETIYHINIVCMNMSILLISNVEERVYSVISYVRGHYMTFMPNTYGEEHPLYIYI